MKLSRRVSTCSLVVAAALSSGCAVDSQDEDGAAGSACEFNNDCKGVCVEQVCVDLNGPPDDPQSYKGSILVSNESEFTVPFLWIKPCGTSDWGNVLGDGVIAPGGTLSWPEVHMGCYDYRAEIDEGGEDWEFLDRWLLPGKTEHLRLRP